MILLRSGANYASRMHGCYKSHEGDSRVDLAGEKVELARARRIKNMNTIERTDASSCAGDKRPQGCADQAGGGRPVSPVSETRLSRTAGSPRAMGHKANVEARSVYGARIDEAGKTAKRLPASDRAFARLADVQEGKPSAIEKPSDRLQIAKIGSERTSTCRDRFGATRIGCDKPPHLDGSNEPRDPRVLSILPSPTTRGVDAAVGLRLVKQQPMRRNTTECPASRDGGTEAGSRAIGGLMQPTPMALSLFPIWTGFLQTERAAVEAENGSKALNDEAGQGVAGRHVVIARQIRSGKTVQGVKKTTATRPETALLVRLAPKQGSSKQKVVTPAGPREAGDSPAPGLDLAWFNAGTLPALREGLMPFQPQEPIQFAAYIPDGERSKHLWASGEKFADNRRPLRKFIASLAAAIAKTLAGVAGIVARTAARTPNSS